MVNRLSRDPSGLYLPAAAAGDGAAFFFVFDDAAKIDVEVEIGAALSSLSGRFGFVAALPASQQERTTLAQRARADLGALAKARVGWFVAGGGTYRLLHSLFIEKSGSVLKFASEQEDLPFKQNFNLVVPKGSVFSWNATRVMFEIANTGTGIEIVGETGSVRTIGNGAVAIDGPQAGRLIFDLTLNDAALDTLDVGLRLFEAASGPAITSVRYPLIDGSKAVAMIASVDPLDQEVAASKSGLSGTFLSFPQGTAVPSHYRTAHGHAVSLMAGDDARLELCDKVHHAANPARTFYLTPSGSFAIQAGSGGMKSLLAGETGTEYFRVETGHTLRFSAGNPAFVTKSTSSNQPFLDGRATTSWATFEAAPAARYIGQPEDAPLFAPAGSPPTLAPSGLSLLPLLEREPRVIDRELALPLLPLGGVRDAEATKAHDLESQAAARHRRRLAAVLPVETAVVALLADSGTGTERATTPHGLIRQFDKAGPEHLLIARSPGEAELAFRDLQDKFKDAVARNRLFLVLSRNGKPGQPQQGFGRFDSRIRIADWQFDLTMEPPAQATSPMLADQAIFIFKFDDRPLKELLAHPEQWAEAEEFNADTAEVSSFLLKYFQEALTSGRPEFRRIRRALDDPKWNGVLAVNALVPKLAPGAESLTPGIKKTLRAHHAAVEMNDVSGALELQDSSFFALINYDDPMPPPKVDDVFVFHVEQLRVLFENSRITDFSCRAKLFARTLFDEALEQPATFVLTGHFESHDGKDTYSFVAEGALELPVKSDLNLIKKVTVHRIELITVDSKENAIESRFLLTGSLAFGDIADKLGIDFFSFDAMHFDKLGVAMHFDRATGKQSITFDPGTIGLDTTLNVERAAGLLENFPLKLKRFQRAGSGIKLPDLGFLEFARHLDTIPIYGLFFELDLGSLGALASSAKDFKAELAFAWSKDSLFAGIRLPESRGGPRSIGLQGVLQILVDDFAFIRFEPPDHKSQVYALAFRRCAIEILGARFPSGDRPDIYLFVNPNEPSNGSNASLGWLMNFPQGGTLGPFSIERFVLGQRVGPSLQPSTVSGALEEIAALPSTKSDVNFDLFKNRLANLFHPDRGWLIGAKMSIGETLTFGFIFNDPVLYGALLELKSTGFAIEITYRKIAEDIGVYHAEITLPESIRQWEFGAVSVTIPKLGVSVYTNGDFLVDVGFPYNFDFSRSCTVQALPFLGSGGFYFARLRGATSEALPFPGLNPVLEIGFGMRLGLGKEFSKGILKAGLSVTFYGLLEGAVGYLPGTPWTEPSDYLVQGRMGVLGQIYGVVDFGIVKAGVSITILIGFGIRLGSRVDTDLWIEGRVSVEVSVVIGRIRIWRVTIEIRINFSFNMEVRFTWKLQSKSSRQAAFALSAVGVQALEAALISWDLLAPPAQRIPLALYFAPEVTLRAGEPQVVGGMAIECAPRDNWVKQTAFDALVDELVRWAVLLHLGTASGTDPKVTPDQLRELDEKLHLPPSLARTAGGTPLDYAAIAAFLAQTFDVTVQGIDQTNVDATYFPILPDVTLVTTVDGAPHQRRDLWAINPRDERYQQLLSDYFNRLVVNRDVLAAAGGAASGGPSLAQIVFQDYFEFIVKAGVDLLWRHMGTNEIDSEHLDKLLDDVVFDDLAGMAARFFKQGLRIPLNFASELPPVEALYQLTGQQIPIPPPSAVMHDFVVALEERPAMPRRWFQLAANPAPRVELDRDEFFAKIGGVVIAPEVTEIRELDPLRLEARRFALRTNLSWANAAAETLVWPLPAPLQSELRALNALPLALVIDRGDKPFKSDPRPLAGEYRFATRIELNARRIAAKEGSGFVKNAYSLGGAAEGNRRDLDALLNFIAANPAGVEIRLAYRDTVEGKLKSDAADPARVLLVRGNYSTETTPPPDLLFTLLSEAAAQPADRATMDQPLSFLRLVQDCSLINTGGYILRYGDNGLPDEIFEGGGRKDLAARVSLIVEAGSSVGQPALRHHNVVVTPKSSQLDPVLAPGGGRVFYAEAATLTDATTLIEPGCVALELVRTNPEVSVALPWSRDFELLYNLLEYRVPDQTAFKASPESLPITPAREDALVEGAPPDPLWRYREVVPLHTLARAGGGRYDSVGAQALVEFDFRDCFGNKLGFQDPQSHRTFTLLYFDKLVPLGAWPALASSYLVRSAAAGAAEIALTLAFDADRLPTERSEISARYALIAEQLSAPGVTLTLGSSLRSNADYVIDPAQKAALLGFLGKIVNFLGGTAAAPGPLTLAAPVSKTTIENEKRAMFELTAAFTIERNAALVHAAAKTSDPEAVRVSTALLPPDEDLKKNKTLATFATALEAAMPSIHVAVGTIEGGGSGIWAVRIGDKGAVSVAPDPAGIRFYAVPPITTDRVQGDFDFDVVGRRFVEAVDWFLGPELAPHAARLADASFDAVAAGKRGLADTIARELVPLLRKDAGSDAELLEGARETFRQKLLINLATAYKVDLAAALPVKVTTPLPGGPRAPKLYGKIGAASPSAEPLPQLTLTSAKVAIGAEPETRLPLAFLIDVTTERDVSSLPLVLRYDVTHVEYFVEGDPFSRWLKFVSPLELPLGRPTVPVPLREYPLDPRLTHSWAEGGKPATATPVGPARAWTYSLTFSSQGAAQDTQFIEVKLNVSEQALLALLDEETLLDALGIFDKEYPTIATKLRDIAATGAGDVTALSEFAALAARVAAAWERHSRAASPAAALLSNDRGRTLLYSVSEKRTKPQELIVTLRRDEASAPFPDAIAVKKWTQKSAKVNGDTVTYTLVPDNNNTANELDDDRTLTFAALDVLREENAWSSVQLRRNFRLAGELTQPQFVYSTPRIRASEPVVALLASDNAIDVSKLAGDTKKTMREHLDTLFAATFEGVASAGTRRIKVVARYAFDLRRKPGLLAIGNLVARHPLYLATPSDVEVPEDNLWSGESVLLPAINSALQDWIANENPSNEGSFLFDLTIYASASEASLPVLRLTNLQLPLAAIA